MTKIQTILLSFSFLMGLQSIAHASSPAPEEFGENLFSVTESDFYGAPCKSEAPSVYEILNHLETFNDDDRIKARKGGLNLVDQPRSLVNAFGSLVKRPGDMLSRTMNLPTSHPASANCTDVVCAVSAVWGRELGLKLLYLKLKHGFNGSATTNSMVV